MSLPTHLSGERSEAGETLIEILMATALMALAVVAILGSLATMMSSSAIHRDQTRANTVLVAAMENVKSSSRVACGTDPTPTYVSQAQNVGPSLPAGWNVSQIAITQIAYETAPAGGAATFSTNAGDCTNSFPLQQITITVTSPNGRVNPSLTFVKGAL